MPASRTLRLAVAAVAATMAAAVVAPAVGAANDPRPLYENPRMPVRERVPPQHRARRLARPGARAPGRARRRRGDPHDRSAVGLRPVHLRGARRPLGAYL